MATQPGSSGQSGDNDLNQSLKSILTPTEGHSQKWIELFEQGATDQQIRSAITFAAGPRGRSDSTYRICQIKTKPDLSFWLNSYGVGAPTLQGQDLVNAVREAFQIPLPTGAGDTNAGDNNGGNTQVSAAADTPVEAEPVTDVVTARPPDSGDQPLLFRSAEMDAANPKTIVLPIAQVRTDGGTQSRAELNEEVIGNYCELYKEGQTLPPGRVWFDGENYWLSDGFHRNAGAERAGLAELPYELKFGTRRDAILDAVGANAEHGLLRSNADKRRAVEMLLADPEWSTWSDRAIAAQARVSAWLVGELRRELSASPLQIDTTRTVKRGEKVYEMKTERIGTRKAEPDAAAPDLPPSFDAASDQLPLPAILDDESEPDNPVTKVSYRFCEHDKLIIDAPWDYRLALISAGKAMPHSCDGQMLTASIEEDVIARERDSVAVSEEDEQVEPEDEKVGAKPAITTREAPAAEPPYPQDEPVVPSSPANEQPAAAMTDIEALLQGQVLFVGHMYMPQLPGLVTVSVRVGTNLHSTISEVFDSSLIRHDCPQVQQMILNQIKAADAKPTTSAANSPTQSTAASTSKQTSRTKQSSRTRAGASQKKTRTGGASSKQSSAKKSQATGASARKPQPEIASTTRPSAKRSPAKTRASSKKDQSAAKG